MDPRRLSRIRMIASQIKRLTPEELRELQKLLDPSKGDDEPDSGVREPRRPRPPRGASGITLEFPEGELPDAARMEAYNELAKIKGRRDRIMRSTKEAARRGLL